MHALRINRRKKHPKGGPLPHMVAASLGDLASAYMREGRMEEALKGYKEGLEIEKKLYGEVHKNSADSMFNLGVAYGTMNRNEEALESFRGALKGFKAFLAEDHPLVLRTIQNINTLKRGLKINAHGNEEL